MKTKKSFFKKKKSKKIGIVSWSRNKLPKSKLKLSFVALTGLLLLSVIVYSASAGYRYYAHKRWVASAHWGDPLYIAPGVSYRVCKVQRRTAYGIVHDFHFRTEKWNNEVWSVYTAGYRPNGPYSSTFRYGGWSSAWYAGIGNTSVAPSLHFLSGDFAYYQINSPRTVEHSKYWYIGDMPFC